eukprot:COSAG06_NODE_4609_length_4102_cov_63.784911_7_plen_91_part_00
MEGRRVVSEAWIDEITSWGPLDQQVRHGTPPRPGTGALCDLSDVGYKCYIWHLKADGAHQTTPFGRHFYTENIPIYTENGHFTKMGSGQA